MHISPASYQMGAHSDLYRRSATHFRLLEGRLAATAWQIANGDDSSCNRSRICGIEGPEEEVNVEHYSFNWPRNGFTLTLADRRHDAEGDLSHGFTWKIMVIKQDVNETICIKTKTAMQHHNCIFWKTKVALLFKPRALLNPKMLFNSLLRKKKLDEQRAYADAYFKS